MSSASSHAVRLPEIVAVILEHLQDKKALFATLQVSKLWADEATTLLWREYPQTLDLARIEDGERLQYYANKVSVLSIQLNDDEHEGHHKLQNVHFPRLRYLSMSVHDCKKEQLFLQYLQPNLRTITVHDGPVSNYCLTQIQTLCPTLRDLSLCDLFGTVTSSNFLDFLNGMPTLARIYLWGGLEDVISDEVYFHLASRPNLAALETGDDKLLKRSLIERMQEVVDRPFPKLEYLLCFAESSAFSQLSRHLNRLTALHLYLDDAASNRISDVRSCTKLVSLSLYVCNSHFEPNSHFPPEGFLALARDCSQLQTFGVTAPKGSRADGGSIPSIDDAVMRRFVALLPGLNSIRLNIETNLTEQVLKYLGEACAGLESCTLDGRCFDLRLLERGGSVLFPQLEWLDLNPIHIEDEFGAAMIAEIIHYHAPRLKVLRLGGPARLGGEVGLIQKVGRKIRELKRHGQTLHCYTLGSGQDL